MNISPDGLARVSCRQYKDGAWRSFEDEAAPEVSVTLLFEGGKTARLWAYPHDLENLALGHALLDHCPDGHVPVVEELPPREASSECVPVASRVADAPPGIGPARAFRARFIPGSRMENAAWQGPLTPAGILQGAASFMDLPGHFGATGCFHRAALYDPATRSFVRHVEDIGRHNCLDRLAGWALGRELPFGGLALFVTARATASLVAKAIRSGHGVMISRSAVTTAGVELARAAGLTLVGFSRENRFSVFTDPHGRLASA